MTRPDEALAVDTVKGDLQAFEELVKRYQGAVFRLAFRMTGQREEAEDAAQEVFIQVFKKMYQFDPDKRFAPWLFRVATNICISRLRARKKVIMLNFDDPAQRRLEFEQADIDADPLISLEKSELQREVQEVLQELPEHYRLLLIMRYQLELNSQEIARSLETTRENVDVKMHRARRLLRTAMLKRLQEREETYGLQTRRQVKH